MKATALSGLLLWVTFSTTAAERTWTGDGGNNLWSNPNNWSPAGAPQNGDELFFQKLCILPTCPTVTVVNDLSNLRVGELHFGGTSGRVDYVVNGNPLILTDWVLIGVTYHETKRATVTFNCPLVLGASMRFDINYGGEGGEINNLYLNGPVDLNGFDLDFVLLKVSGNGSARAYISGTISGTGNVNAYPQDTCEVEFNGPADNTFTGTLRLSGELGEEIFRFNKTGGAVTHGRLVIGGVCRWLRPHQIGDEATLVVTDAEGFRAGKLYFQGNNETVRNLEMLESTQADEPNNGLLDTGGGILTVLNRLSTTANGGTPVIRGRLAVPSALTLDINGTEFYGLDLQADISGGGDMTKIGNAALILSGNSTFTGYLFVDSASVEPRHANAFGSVTRGVLLRGGALRLINRTISGESLWSITRDGSALFSLGTATWAGEIHLERDLQIYGENFTHAHAITGTGGLSLFGGTITFADSAHNTFTGATEVHCELLQLNKPTNTRAFSVRSSSAAISRHRTKFAG
jgi:autotransporter-associated beta strand protein